MILNERVPGYPPWPYIKLNEGRNEYVVFGDHVSYAAYGWTQWLIDAATHVGFFVTWYFIFTAKHLSDSILYFCVYFFVYLPVVTLVPIAQFACNRLYPCKDRVVFTRKGIVIRGKTYAILPQVPIQFRANRSPMREGKFNRLRAKDQADGLRHKVAYKLEFRQVEMIYGARIIPITTVAPEDLAQQYAIVLQIAYDLVTRDDKSSAHSHDDRQRENAYPE